MRGVTRLHPISWEYAPQPSESCKIIVEVNHIAPTVKDRQALQQLLVAGSHQRRVAVYCHKMAAFAIGSINAGAHYRQPSLVYLRDKGGEGDVCSIAGLDR